MFIRRTDVEADGCPSNRINCDSGTSMAIAGSSHSGDPMDSASTSTDSTTTTQYVDKPGLHRYIGIVMVVVLIVLIIIGWAWYMRRKRQRIAREAEAEQAAGDSPNLSEGGVVDEKTPNSRFGPLTPVVTEKERSLMLQSEPRGVIKEVSGGVVMFTEAPRIHPGKDRYPVDWEFEHVKGVRYEAKKSQRNSQHNSLRRPSLAHRTSPR
ncbi:hypothetical protein CPC08DRAFT_2198 [Agrocybe pediades]|nr:hypothetical protein CPC08DRAFT_2198 [Agrocybe pediades]